MTVPFEFHTCPASEANVEENIEIEFAKKVCHENGTTKISFQPCINLIHQIVDTDALNLCEPGNTIEVILDLESLKQNYTSEQLNLITSVCQLVNASQFNTPVTCLRKIVEEAGIFSKNEDEETGGDIEGCHELLSEYNPVLDRCKFWLEGISLCVIGFFGLCGNTLAIIVLGSTKDSNR